MRLTAALMLWFVLGGQTYPPPYPRSGTKALIDNARAQVWDVSWPKGQPSALHRHLYDMTGLYYWPGDQLKGITHIEEGTSEDPLRAVMIELKGDGPSHQVEKKDGVAAFTGPAMPLLDNERVTVWDYARPSAPANHNHPMDTFVVWTEGRVGHAVFLPAGTGHTDEPIGSASKATIFELK